MTKPIAFTLDEATQIKEPERDVFALPPSLELPETEPKSTLALWFWSCLAGLLSLSFGLWVTSLIELAFSKFPFLGWLTLGLALLVALIALLIFIKEMRALRHLRKVSDLHRAPSSAKALALLAPNPHAARGLNAYEAAIKDAVLDERDRLTLIDNLILKPLDEEAIKLICAAAKRVSVVTALSPKAIVDIVMVFITALALIRRLAKLYGARAGTLGFLRLTRQVFTHLTLTAGIAFGDSLLQQILGAGLATKLSAKLGEGVINGFLTARLGLAAMRVTRPLAFTNEQPSLKAVMDEVLRLS